MLTAVLGLVGAFTYGSADFLGGIAARRISALRVTAIGAVTGLALLLLALPFTGGEWSAPAVAWGALSGVTGAIAISLLYACLAIGPMSILSPTTALVSAVVPLTWGLAGGARLHPAGYLGLGFALAAVVLVGFVPEKGAVRPSLRGIGMAVGSGAMIGAFIIIIDQTPPASGVVPLVLNRAVNAAIMLTAIGLLAGQDRRAAARAGTTLPVVRRWLPGLPFALACGVLDTTANVLILAGIRVGGVTVTSVLVALYPAGTIILAALVLRERIAPVQWGGLGLAVAAGALLALP